MAPRSSTKLSELYSDLSPESNPVFLGGSCNPTLWRKDVAIPYLNKRGITYFNPQVSCWSPDLIQLENKAKQEAKVNLFVIDWQTRSVAALVEVAHLVAGQRGSSLVVALYDLEPSASFSESETKELSQAREFVRSLMHSRKLPVYPSLQDALEVTEKKVQPTSGVRSPKRKSQLRAAATNSFKSLVIKSCHLGFSLWDLMTNWCNRLPQLIIVTSDVLLLQEQTEIQNTEYKLVSPLALPHAEELLKLCSREEETTPLLVVLSGRQRALMEMVLAARLIRSRPNLVLCIQEIFPNTCLNEEESSEEVIKDYNRGRSYLEDLALQHTVPVYADVGLALEHTVHLAHPLSDLHSARL